MQSNAFLAFYSSLKDLVLRGSLVFHCSYINTVNVGRDATSKRRPETISGLRKTNRCHISRQNGHQLALCHLLTQPKQSEFILKYSLTTQCLCVHEHVWMYVCVRVFTHTHKHTHTNTHTCIYIWVCWYVCGTHKVTSMFWGTVILLPTQRRYINWSSDQ